MEILLGYGSGVCIYLSTTELNTISSLSDITMNSLGFRIHSHFLINETHSASPPKLVAFGTCDIMTIISENLIDVTFC